MYRVTSREIEPMLDPLDSDIDNVRGVLTTIEPPIHLNPVAFETYASSNSLTHQYRGEDTDDYHLHDITVLGSTDTATAIYAGCGIDSVEHAIDAMEVKTASFLRAMGAEVIQTSFESQF